MKKLAQMALFGLVLALSTTICAQQPPAFDGPALYKQAFEALRDNSLPLADKAARDKFIADYENKHATDGKLQTKQGTYEAIVEMQKSLKQRFDRFQDEAQTKRFQQTANAQMTGIGVRIRLKGVDEILKKLPKNATEDDVKNALVVDKDHPLIVDEAIEGAPADKAGIKAGDSIVKVDGTALSGMKQEDALKKIGGQKGTDVEIIVERDDGMGGTKQVTFKITRDTFTLKVVSFEAKNDIAVVKLADFMSKFSVKEMEDALTKAANEKALILDLRNNGGGRLDYCFEITQMLLPKGSVLDIHRRQNDDIFKIKTSLTATHFETEQGMGLAKAKMKDPRRKLIIPADMPIIVLVNENSASASEILAGCLQANKRVIVVGKTTVKKGVGQNVYELKPWGVQILITTFEFLPGGKKMDGIGVIPDHDVDQQGSADTQMEFAKKKAAELIKP